MGASKNLMDRRCFLQRVSTTTTGLAAFSLLPAIRGAESPNNRVTVGVMGTSRNSNGGDGRGAELAVGLASLPGVEVAYVCDADARNVPKAIESVVTKGKQRGTPRGVKDFRDILGDKAVDALVIATPDHWHAPAAILACAANKHVYVEKPCCHNPREGELLVAAARKHRRQVQHGTQRRSWPGVREGIERLRGGAIGRVLFAKCWYYGPRPSIGRGREVPAPDWLDYSLWQGPAPDKPYRDNVVPYNWHWFWHWGTGEMGNNGVHFIDVCRWGLGLDYPVRITSAGGKYRYPEDDQETPDTNVVNFDFGKTTLTWEQRSWAPHLPQDPPYDVAFYGENGLMTFSGGGYAIFDPKGQEIAKGSGNGGNQVHLQNFIDAIREAKPLNAEIEEGHKSTLLCHLGNIAYRTNKLVNFEPETRRPTGRTAWALWSRDYRRGWEPRV